jgi:hypothetical protein
LVPALTTIIQHIKFLGDVVGPWKSAEHLKPEQFV